MREEDPRGEQPSAEDCGVMLEEAIASKKKKSKAADFRITQCIIRNMGRRKAVVDAQEQEKEPIRNTANLAEIYSRKSWSEMKF